MKFVLAPETLSQLGLPNTTGWKIWARVRGSRGILDQPQVKWSQELCSQKSDNSNSKFCKMNWFCTLPFCYAYSSTAILAIFPYNFEDFQSSIESKSQLKCALGETYQNLLGVPEGCYWSKYWKLSQCLSEFTLVHSVADRSEYLERCSDMKNNLHTCFPNWELNFFIIK